jgi:hypothetical protein
MTNKVVVDESPCDIARSVDRDSDGPRRRADSGVGGVKTCHRVSGDSIRQLRPDSGAPWLIA